MKVAGVKESLPAEKYFLKKAPEFTKRMAQKRYQAINALLKITQVTGNHPDIGLSLMALMDLAAEMVPYDWGLFYFRQEDRESLELKASRGIDHSFPSLLEKGNLIAHWTMRQKKPILIARNAEKEMERYFSILETDSLISVPILIHHRIAGILQIGGKRGRHFTEEDALLIWMLAMQAQTIFHPSRSERAFLKKMAMTDGLTGLYNRRYFDEQVDHEIQRSCRTGKPFVLMMMDVDFFKKYNDRYKHLKGDQALREIATILKARLRQIDTVSRFGGEEFSILLPETGGGSGSAVAREIRYSIKNHSFIGEEKAREVKMTVSIGCSVFPQDGTDKEALIHRADLALYHAKESGRDQVFLFSRLKDQLSIKNKGETKCLLKSASSGFAGPSSSSS
ncbi:MAG TPA: sensor domain-containing diguanylate cyclase [Candidatus Manganitrophaceae bacterium]|nr:sensor domain-containing diguanylate cyclase [Candidatus Manganitrophaceae bacterium]